jgi:hypothetical protein
VTDTGIPFADGDDPDDAWSAGDTVLQLLPVLRRRVLYAMLALDHDRDTRLLSIADDIEWLRQRLENGEP